MVAYDEQEVAVLKQSLDAKEQITGPEVPEYDVAFIPTLPAHIVSISGSVGTKPGSDFIKLAAGYPILKVQLNPSYISAIHLGQEVAISDSITSYKGQEVITHIGQLSSSGNSGSSAVSSGSLSNSGTGSSYYPITITPLRNLTTSFLGENVQINILAAKTKGPVLVVPISAIFATSDGNTYVSVLKSGQEVRVAVKTGISGNGDIAITPLQSNALLPGEQVVDGVR